MNRNKLHVDFIVHGEPKGKARPRFSRRTMHTYTPKETTDYETAVKKAYLDAADGVYFGNLPLKVEIYAAYKIPKSTTKKNKERMILGELFPCKKPDADNIAKMMDGLNKIAWDDDSQVVQLFVEKSFVDSDEGWVRWVINEI